MRLSLPIAHRIQEVCDVIRKSKNVSHVLRTAKGVAPGRGYAAVLQTAKGVAPDRGYAAGLRTAESVLASRASSSTGSRDASFDYANDLRNAF